MTGNILGPAASAVNCVTVVRTAERANKLVRHVRGEITKQAGIPVSAGQAVVVEVSHAADLMLLLHEVSADPNMVLIFGAPAMPANTPFLLVSKRTLCRLKGWPEGDADDPTKAGKFTGMKVVGDVVYWCRVKANFRPSRWVLLDHDQVEGQPAELSYSSAEQWWQTMQELWPGFESAAVVLWPSSSGRILLDGRPLKQTGFHGAVQVVDPQDANRFGKALLMRGFTTGHSFMRPIGGGGRRHWSIFDPSTFSPERVVFEGRPTLQGEGLTLAPFRLRHLGGGLLDTRQLATPSGQEAQHIARMAGLQLRRDAHGRTTDWLLHDDGSLRLNTMIQTKLGPMTVGEFWISRHQRLRCQTPFRPESVSWAAHLGRHRDNSPFLHDVGLGCKYTLSRGALLEFF